LPGFDSGILSSLGSNNNDVFPATTFTAGGTQESQTASTSTAAPANAEVKTEMKMEAEDEEL